MYEIPPQQILSTDSVTLTVDAVIYYRVFNPIMVRGTESALSAVYILYSPCDQATNNVEDYRHSTHLLGATTLRNVLGTKNLSEILSERDTISNVMKTLLDEATDPWGVRVERVEVKDVRVPENLQRAMAAEAEAARNARAKV